MRRLALAATSAIVPAIVLACVDLIGIDPVPDGAASSDGGDGGDAATTCDPLAAFSSPNVVLGINPLLLDSIRLSPDELSVFMCRSIGTPNAPINLGYASRATTTGSFGQETMLVTDQRVCSASMTADRLTLFWDHADVYDGSAVTPRHLLTTTRPNVTTPFAFDGGKALVGLDMASEVGPFVRADGRELYYIEVKAGVATELYATIDSGFQVGVAIPGIPSGAYDLVVSPDGLVAYYVLGSYMTVAQRSSTSNAFGSGSKTTIPSFGGQQQPVLLTADYCKLYYVEVGQTQGADSEPQTTLYYVMRKP